MARCLLTLVVLAMCAASASAQTPVEAPAGSPAVCAYDDCALRIEPEWFGSPRIVRGVDGVPIGRIGFFFGDDLSRAVSGNAPAVDLARRAERLRGQGVLLGLAGGALFYTAFFTNYGAGSDSDAAVAAAAVLVGAGLTFAGGVVQVRANRAQSRAVWEYNRGLAR